MATILRKGDRIKGPNGEGLIVVADVTPDNAFRSENYTDLNGNAVTPATAVPKWVFDAMRRAARKHDD